jgi:undecaprenyl-phosphate 4-deoxy-4-formamido-L-arabinose transferase
MTHPDSLSIVIPVYNSQDILPELARRLADLLPQVCQQYELLFVNDGSQDQSWEKISELCDQSEWIRGINLMRNYGQHNALLCGIRAARFPVTITMDDDLQHPPEEIPLLLAKLAEGFDVIYGTPQREKHNLWRVIASRITKLALQSAMGAKTASQVSAFRAFRTQVREAFAEYQGPHVSIDVLLTWGTSRFESIPTHHQPRYSGTSNYTIRKLIRHAINMITGFSILPLRFASLTGFGFAIFGLLILFYVIGRFLLQGSPVPGFPFLASIIAIFSGVQLFALGIIGEYIARMHFRLMDRPAYVIREQRAAVLAGKQRS